MVMYKGQVEQLNRDIRMYKGEFEVLKKAYESAEELATLFEKERVRLEVELHKVTKEKTT